MDCHGKLTIYLINAKLTRDVCTFGSMDPSCTLTLSPTKIFHSTAKMNEGKYPLWNEIALFDVNYEKVLKVEVYHQQEIVNLQ